MNRAPADDDRHMAHLLNALSVTVLLYAAGTRGMLIVARGLAYIAARVG
jgi:hypothetical protein